MPPDQKSTTCRHCGTEFTYRVKLGQKPQLCSDECRTAAAAEYNRRWREAKGRTRPVRDEACKVCGDALPPYTRGQPKKFCSRECRMRWRSFAALGVEATIYVELLKAQGGVCAICSGRNPKGSAGKHFAIDHCHDSGVVRGLLCSACNQALGLLGDDPARMRRAATYVEAHRS